MVPIGLDDKLEDVEEGECGADDEASYVGEEQEAAPDHETEQRGDGGGGAEHDSEAEQQPPRVALVVPQALLAFQEGDGDTADAGDEKEGLDDEPDVEQVVGGVHDLQRGPGRPRHVCNCATLKH
jgi:hypothetical protein